MRFGPRVSLLLLVGSALSACGGSGVRDAALRDDLAGLQRAIADAQKRGELDEGVARDVARAVVERELGTARGDSAVARVRELRPCVGSVEDVLSELAEHRTAGGGAATLALLDAGRTDPEDFVELYANDKDPVWRAVGARASIGADHFERRVSLMTDADLRVRRAALHAALDEPVLEDAPALLEAARLDPDPLVRSLAVLALGALGGERVVTALVDLWPRADQQTRQVIVDAWARDPSYAAGGEARLLSTLETEQGLPKLVAARALVAQQSSHAGLAAATLLRAVQSGSADERRLAIRWVPLDAGGIEALEQAMQSEDGSVSVLAAARLTAVAKHRDAAIAKLRGLSGGDSPSLQRQAQAALSVLGDRSIVKALRAAQEAESSDERRLAAMNLVRLGDYASAATSLGDSAATVRTSVACAMLGAR